MANSFEGDGLGNNYPKIELQIHVIRQGKLRIKLNSKVPNKGKFGAQT